MLLCCCFLRCFIFCVIGNLPIIGAASGSCCACLIACLSSKKDFQRMLFKRCTNKMMESFAFFTVRGLSVCWLLLTSVFAGADMLCFWSQSLSSRAKKKKKKWKRWSHSGAHTCRNNQPLSTLYGQSCQQLSSLLSRTELQGHFLFVHMQYNFSLEICCCCLFMDTFLLC